MSVYINLSCLCNSGIAFHTLVDHHNNSPGSQKAFLNQINNGLTSSRTYRWLNDERYDSFNI